MGKNNEDKKLKQNEKTNKLKMKQNKNVKN